MKEMKHNEKIIFHTVILYFVYFYQEMSMYSRTVLLPPEIINSQAISNRDPKRNQTIFVRNKTFHRSCLHQFTLTLQR